MSTVTWDWTGIEDAMGSWVLTAAGFAPGDVRLPVQRDSGEARGPAPKAMISLLSKVPIGQVGEIPIIQVMRQRYTVTATGPGTVGVNFYPGTSLTPVAISHTAGIGELPPSSAAALLIELQANLPAGYTASADPGDTSSVLVDGTEGEPLFAALPLDAGFLTVFDAIPRTTTLLNQRHRVVYRISFRRDDVNGDDQATESMQRCEVLRTRLLDPAMRALGFASEGTPASQPLIAIDRVDTTALLDVAFRGHLTQAVARNTGRAIGIQTQLAS